MAIDNTMQQLGVSIINLVDKKSNGAVEDALAALNDKIIGGESGQTIAELVEEQVNNAIAELDLSSYATKIELQTAIGDISTALDTINGEEV